MNEKLDNYETALLTELRTYVAERQVTATRPRRTLRRLAFVGVAAAAAAGIAVVSLPGGGTPAASAYSTVSVAPNGGVQISVSLRDDADTVERVLADHGVNADVTFLPPYQVCDGARYQARSDDKDFQVALGSGDSRHVTRSDGKDFYFAGGDVPGAFTVDISRAPAAGETLILDSTVGLPDIDEDNPNANHTWVGLVTGDVPTCVPVAAPSKG